jgi:magnesium transporter
MRALIHEGDGVRELTEPDEIAASCKDKGIIWVDVGERTEAADRLLDQVFQLHPLVVEDLWGDRALPKIDRYDDYLFLLVHGVRAGSSAEELELIEIDIVIGKNYLLTHHTGSRAVASVFEQSKKSSKLLAKGPAWAMHAILDELVEHYLPVLDEFDHGLEQLESDVLEPNTSAQNDLILGKILSFKRSLQLLRRNSIHQREILYRLSKGEFPEIPKQAIPFYRDVYDHYARVTDLADGYRELVTSALDAYFSMQSSRMNEVMKTLTLISTVMLPLTFIAGIYGMNFERMPELKWVHGYPFALGLMGVVALGILLYFKRKGLL